MMENLVVNPEVTQKLIGERWRYIKGYYGLYMISDQGRVKSLPKPGSWIEKPLVPLTGEYLVVRLMKNNHAKSFRLHRLVAQHFIANPSGYDKVNHKSGYKHDNRATNLEWCTERMNRLHAYAMGLDSKAGQRNGNARYTAEQIVEMRAYRNVKPSKEVAELFDTSASYVRQIWSRNKWRPSEVQS